MNLIQSEVLFYLLDL